MAAIYCDCGGVLVEDVSPEGVTPIGGEPIRFRRQTDYIVCPNCYSVYKAAVLLDGGTLDEARIEKPDAPEPDVIDKLEQLVEENDQAP